MIQYQQLLRLVLEKGKFKPDRTGTGTYSVFGAQARFPLQEGFPCLTTKKLHLKSIIYELLWFLKGETNIKWLNEHGVTIWDEWADENGNLGPIYGKQWREWETKDGRVIDQIANVIERIKANPDCRRLIVSAWNPGEIDQMALPPCHCFFQFYVIDGELSCQLYQRSVFWRLAPLLQSHRAGQAPALSRAAETADDEDQSRRQKYLRLQVRGLRAAGVRPASRDQGSDSRVAFSRRKVANEAGSW